MRAGLEKEDRVMRINNKTPRNIQDAIEILRKSKVKHSIGPPLIRSTVLCGSGCDESPGALRGAGSSGHQKHDRPPS